jgi:hypothetical protein
VSIAIAGEQAHEDARREPREPYVDKRPSQKGNGWACSARHACKNPIERTDSCHPGTREHRCRADGIRSSRFFACRPANDAGARLLSHIDEQIHDARRAPHAANRSKD